MKETTNEGTAPSFCKIMIIIIKSEKYKENLFSCQNKKNVFWFIYHKQKRKGAGEGRPMEMSATDARKRKEKEKKN
jgi:hypothetical protein